VATCDICSAVMSLEESAAFSAEHLGALAAKGFGPPERVMALAKAAGLSSEQVMDRLQRRLLQKEKSTWLLCPDCSSRAAVYQPRPVGTHLADPAGRTPPGALPAADTPIASPPASLPPSPPVARPLRWSRPAAPPKQGLSSPRVVARHRARRRRFPVLLIGLLVIVAMILFAPLLADQPQSTPEGAPTEQDHPASTPTPTVPPVPNLAGAGLSSYFLSAMVTRSPELAASKGSRFQLP
jgi:hypothetical protein